MPTLEGIRLKFRNKVYIPLTCKTRGKQLKNKEFTIISNNCWGGTVYEAHNLQKQSPTIGMFFMAEDYIKFLSDIKGYVCGEFKFIRPENSRWKDVPQVCNDSRFGSYPIGVLSNSNQDIEIFFLHAHSEKEAREKWERRCNRINWDRLLVKFNDQNGCSEADIQNFINLPYKNKLFFTSKHWKNEKIYKVKMGRNYLFIPQLSVNSSIKASREPFGKRITDILNTL